MFQDIFCVEIVASLPNAFSDWQDMESPTSHRQKSGAMWYRISKAYRAFTNFKLSRNQRGYLLVDSPLMFDARIVIDVDVFDFYMQPFKIAFHIYERVGKGTVSHGFIAIRYGYSY